jgi:CubicO group peptidase (beta-lactamase class C family)
MSGTASPRVAVEGQVSPGFEVVREAFAENFTHRHELGGACCAYLDGERVVDLWGGVRNKTGEPWERDTMVVVHSATKGLAAMTLALAHSRGWLDYEERVATYWPEFAQNGKEKVTVRQLLAHQAGLFAFDESVDRNIVANLDQLAAVMARHRPAWEPGTRQAYHGLTLGFYEGELMRRVDPAPSQSRAVLPGRDCIASRRGVLHRVTRWNRQRSPRHPVASGHDDDALRIPSRTTAGRGAQPSIECRSRARRESRDRDLPR